MSSIVTEPRVAIGPRPSKFVQQAILDGGGQPVDADKPADALVWLAPSDTDGLRTVLAATSPRWVQLSSAGVERTAAAGLFDTSRTWTSAKGSYAEPVAEHALMLTLAGLRCMRTRITARSWGESAGRSLFDQPVTILGGGGISEALLRLLAPFRADTTVLRRNPEPVSGATRTLPMSKLDEALSTATVVVLALALTPETERIIGPAQLEAMRTDAWLVNVARGQHIDTDALVAALDQQAIGGAALDVTDPEPLPDGHPLWQQERCIITPHVADTWDMARGMLAKRITENVMRFAAGQQLEGLVDPVAGY